MDEDKKLNEMNPEMLHGRHVGKSWAAKLAREYYKALGCEITEVFGGYMVKFPKKALEILADAGCQTNPV